MTNGSGLDFSKAHVKIGSVLGGAVIVVGLWLGVSAALDSRIEARVLPLEKKVGDIYDRQQKVIDNQNGMMQTLGEIRGELRALRVQP